MPADPIQILRTRDALKKVRGGRDGLYPLLELSTWDVVHYFDDFLGDTIRGDATRPGIYEEITGSDGQINILANQPNGVAEIRASDGSGSDNEYAGISLPELAFTGERQAVFAARIQIDNLANVKIELGFTDVTTDAGAVNVKATPSFTATDFVGWVLDTDDNANWEGLGVQAGTAATTVEAGISPTAATFETLVVALHDTNAKFFRLNANGEKTYESDWMVSAVTADTQLCPWMFIQLRTGSIDRNMQVDFLDVRARRTVS
jgi:hypothetical protein